MGATRSLLGYANRTNVQRVTPSPPPSRKIGSESGTNTEDQKDKNKNKNQALTLVMYASNFTYKKKIHNFYVGKIHTHIVKTHLLFWYDIHVNSHVCHTENKVNNYKFDK